MIYLFVIISTFVFNILPYQTLVITQMFTILAHVYYYLFFSYKFFSKFFIGFFIYNYYYLSTCISLTTAIFFYNDKVDWENNNYYCSLMHASKCTFCFGTDKIERKIVDSRVCYSLACLRLLSVVLESKIVCLKS